MSTSHTMIIVHCWVDPKNALEFEGHLRKAYESTIAEPECLYFEIMTNPSSPGEYIFTEGWSLTKEEFLISQKSGTKDYRKPWLDAAMRLYLRPPTEEFLDRKPGWSYHVPNYFDF